MQAQFPRIAVRLDHFRLADHFVIRPVLHIPLAHKRLEVGAKLHPIRRVNVDHLHLPAHTLVFQQRIHHMQRIPQHHAVHPRPFVLIGFQLFGNIQLRIAKQIQIRPRLPVTVQPVQNPLGGMALMHKQRNGRDADLMAFRLARPVQKRLGQGLQARGTIADATEFFTRPLPHLCLRKHGGFALFSGFGNPHQQPLGKLASSGFIPTQFGRQRRIIAVFTRRLMVAEALLYAHIRALDSLLLVFVQGGFLRGFGLLRCHQLALGGKVIR